MIEHEEERRTPNGKSFASVMTQIGLDHSPKEKFFAKSWCDGYSQEVKKKPLERTGVQNIFISVVVDFGFGKKTEPIGKNDVENKGGNKTQNQDETYFFDEIGFFKNIFNLMVP